MKVKARIVIDAVYCPLCEKPFWHPSNDILWINKKDRLNETVCCSNKDCENSKKRFKYPIIELKEAS